MARGRLEYEIYRICSVCKGTGLVTVYDDPYDSGPPVEIGCPQCNGLGDTLECRIYAVD